MRLRTNATNRKLAPHVGSSATCWTAYCQGLGFNKIAMYHANILDATGREVWSKLNNLESNCSTMDGREYQAIEQNAEKPSRWGQLARDGHQVVQFKDSETNRFVAVAVNGKVTVYGAREPRKGAVS